MPPTTFDGVVRRVLAHCPLAPALLAASWVQDAYNEASDRGAWSFLRADGNLIINARKSGACNVTRATTTVQGVVGGLQFAATDVGRQFRVAAAPPYTILEVDLTAPTYAILDRPYGDTTLAAAGGIILDAFITMPEDFGHFIAVIDPQNNWQLHLWMTEEELNTYDPRREATTTPFAIVSRQPSGVAATLGQIQYELWPYQPGAAYYPYYYIRRPAQLQDDDYFVGPFRHRTDVLVTGALAKCAMWPGLENRRNPYASMDRAKMLEQDYNAQVELLQMRDQEIYLTWLKTVDLQRIPWAPIDAKWMQSHE